MEADGAPSTPPPATVSAPFSGIQSDSYRDQRKVEADVEVTEDRTGDLSLRKPRTSQLSHDCSYNSMFVSSPATGGRLSTAQLNQLTIGTHCWPAFGKQITRMLAKQHKYNDYND